MTDVTSDKKLGTSASVLGRMSISEFTSSVVLSYAVAALVVVWCVYSVGHWQILAGTRLLDILISAAIVQFHDLVTPAPFTLPEAGVYFESQEPIDWRLVIMAIVVFVVFSLVKAYKYSEIARLHGVEGSTGQRMRAFLYGDGLDRFLPFYIGCVGTAAALANQGARFDRALSASAVHHAFTIFEVAVFSTVLLFVLGWDVWIGQLVWPLAILAVAYFVIRPASIGGASSRGVGSVASLGHFTVVTGLQAFRTLARAQPGMLFKLCLISILAFWLLDIAIYMVVEAFNDTERSYSVSFPLLLMAIVGGYLARLIPITPGGIGQWEFGFAASFTIYGSNAFGIDLSYNLVFTAILASTLRSVTGFLLMGGVLVFYGVPTDLRSVFRIFRGAEAPPGMD